MLLRQAVKFIAGANDIGLEVAGSGIGIAGAHRLCVPAGRVVGIRRAEVVGVR